MSGRCLDVAADEVCDCSFAIQGNSKWGRDSDGSPNNSATGLKGR